MASLSPLDPEEMARVIANAMQGVGTEGEREEAGMGVGGEPGEQVDSPEAGLHEARKVGDVRGEPPSSWAPCVCGRCRGRPQVCGEMAHFPG